MGVNVRDVGAGGKVADVDLGAGAADNLYKLKCGNLLKIPSFRT